MTHTWIPPILLSVAWLLPVNAYVPNARIHSNQVAGKMTKFGKQHTCDRGAFLSGIASLILCPSSALATRGAAELDAEFYLRDLFGGNRKEGNIQASTPPTPDPPRTLQGPWLLRILTKDYAEDCLAVSSLIAQVAKSGDSKQVAIAIREKASEIRHRSEKSFYVKTPWAVTDTKDQYYFDVSSYALWKVASEMLPDYRERDAFVRSLGRSIYQDIIHCQSGVKNAPSPVPKAGLSKVSPSLQSLMNDFRDSGFCKGYRLGDETTKDGVIFDEIDDEALQSGGSVDLLISVYEPATLGASLQITGEQSRFSPDLVGPTVAALFETIGVKSSWETYFVDQKYRPNPKDYFPDEQLLQFTLLLA